MVKNNILVASRGPNGGYRLAKERRKIMVSDIISSVSSSSSSDLKDFYNTQISKFLIEPLITKVTKKSFELLNNISVEDIYKLATTSKNQNLKKESRFCHIKKEYLIQLIKQLETLQWYS